MVKKTYFLKIPRQIFLRDSLLFLVIGVVIFLRYVTTRPVYKNGQNIQITSLVLSDPIKYPTSVFLKLDGLKIYLPVGSDISYGDKIVVRGVINDGKLEKAKLLSVEERRVFLSGFRNSLISFYQSILPEPMAGLLGGIVLGAKGALSSGFYEQTKNVGVAHVVVASGTNVSFVISFLLGITTFFFSRKKAIPFVVLGIILYLFVSGFDPPLMRAFIMASVLFISQIKGRLVSSWRILIITAFIMLIYKPDWISDLGFILSFVSTASLMLFEAKIRNYLKKVPEVLKEGLSTSLAAQIGVSPIIFVTFGKFNLLSPLVNALVLWTVPFIMVLGAVGGVVGLVFPFLGKIILLLLYPLLWWFVHIVTFFNF